MLSAGCWVLVPRCRVRCRVRRLDVQTRTKRADDGLDIAHVDRFIERHGDRAVGPNAKVDLRRDRSRRNPVADLRVAAGGARHIESRRIEVLAVHFLDADVRQCLRQRDRVGMHSRRDPGQTLWTVIHRIQTGDVRQQRLCGADIRRRLLATNVLLPGLQRHAIRGVAVRVDRHADDPARRLSQVPVERGKECSVRSAVAERNAESLRIAVHHIGTEFAGRRQQHTAQQIGSDGDQHVGMLGAGDEILQVVHTAVRVRCLHQRAKHPIAEHHVGEFIATNRDHFDAERFCSRPYDVHRLRKDRVADEELRGTNGGVHALRLHTKQHRHRFGSGGRLVEQRGVRDLHPRQVPHHRLEIQQRFETALRNFRLVRRIRRVPAWVFEDIAKDHARRHGVVIAVADERPENLIPGCNPAQILQEMMFALAGRQGQRFVETNPGRYRFVDQRVE